MENKVVIGVELETKSFDAEIKMVERELNDMVENYEIFSRTKAFDEQSDSAVKFRAEIQKVSNKLQDLKKKQDNLDNSNLSKIPASLNGIGNGIEGVIKKVARWGLALFGIRSMYNFIRQSMSTITSQDEQLQADIDYMKNALAYTLEPIVRKIVEFMKQLMFYVAYIIKAWTGKNIFENANKSLSGANKQAKKLSKTLAGFDEMNILSDSSGGDGSGATAPSIDLSNLENVKIPKWIQWIADHKKEVLGFFLELGLLIGAIKLAKFLSRLEVETSVIGGIIALVGGLIIFIKGIIDYLKNPTWENFSKILAGIAVIAAGVFLIFGGFPAIIAAIVGAVIALGLAIYKNWDNIKQTLSKASTWIINNFKGVVNNVKSFFNTLPSFFSGIVNRITGFFRNLGYTAGNVIGAAFKSVVNGVLRTIENILNTPIRTINSLISTINKISPVKIGKLSTFSLPRLAKGGIVNMPSRGVPIGGAIAGERGQEGVIPLTDSQQMALLGEAIGKYITINANITNTMNGRVISREIQRVQNNSNFAMNR